MFTRADVEKIDKAYFQIISTSSYHIILKSKNTGHSWDIQCKELFSGRQSLVIHHKHVDSDPFHDQLHLHPRTVIDAQRLIKEHDLFQMRGRK